MTFAKYSNLKNRKVYSISVQQSMNQRCSSWPPDMNQEHLHTFQCFTEKENTAAANIKKKNN